jgi:hypothetical protein
MISQPPVWASEGCTANFWNWVFSVAVRFSQYFIVSPPTSVANHKRPYSWTVGEVDFWIYNIIVITLEKCAHYLLHYCNNTKKMRVRERHSELATLECIRTQCKLRGKSCKIFSILPPPVQNKLTGFARTNRAHQNFSKESKLKPVIFPIYCCQCEVEKSLKYT